jgi:plasmid stabilization system protein ParE
VIRPIRFEGAAERELEAIVRWYEERRSGLGGAFAEAIDDILSIVAETPLAFVGVEDSDPNLGLRRATMAHFPYVVAYATVGPEVWVVAIAHQRRDR